VEEWDDELEMDIGQEQEVIYTTSMQVMWVLIHKP